MVRIRYGLCVKSGCLMARYPPARLNLGGGGLGEITCNSVDLNNQGIQGLQIKGNK